jgi:hypothetical protein
MRRFVEWQSNWLRHTPAYLVDPVETTDYKLLEVQLGCNAHEELHVQLVVVGLERPCSSTTSNLIHHRSLNLQEVPILRSVSYEFGIGT